MDRIGELVSELALRRQQIAPLPARAVRPEDVPSGRVGELRRHGDVGPRDSIGARYDVAYVEPIGDFRQRCRACLERAARQARDDAQPRRHRERIDDAVGEQIADSLVLVVGEQVRERDDCDGRLQGGAVAAGRRNAAPVQRRAQPVSPNRPVDVLQVAIAEILDVGIEGVAEEVAELGGRNGLTGFRQGADPGCQVDADAVDVRHPVEDLCGVQPGPKAEPLPIGQRRAPSGHPAVHLGRSADRFRRSLELGHQTVAQVLDETPAESGQCDFLDVVRERLPALDHAGFVLLHEANGFDEVDDEDDGVATRQAQPDVRHRIIRAWRHVPLLWAGF